MFLQIGMKIHLLGCLPALSNILEENMVIMKGLAGGLIMAQVKISKEIVFVSLFIQT